MAFNFQPSDGLLNKSVFPSVPVNETEARNQFMILFNQIKDYLNSGIDATKLNGKKASDFSLSTHTHTNYAASNHTHNYLSTTGTAANSNKVGGKKITVSKTQPSSPSTGDVWISW